MRGVMEGAHQRNFEREQAIEKLKGAAQGVLFTKAAQLSAVFSLHLPYYLMEGEITTHPDKEPARLLYAIDAVSAGLDLFHFEEPPALGPIPEGRRMPPVMELEEAVPKLEDRLCKLASLKGFFAVKRLQVRATPEGQTVWMPYWVGLYRQGAKARLEVFDAVRGTLEGRRLRELVADWWLAQDHQDSTGRV